MLTFDDSLPDAAPILPATTKIQPVPPPVSKATRSKVRKPYLVDLQPLTLAIKQKAEWKITPTSHAAMSLFASSTS
jgi:hypothetical protein